MKKCGNVHSLYFINLMVNQCKKLQKNVDKTIKKVLIFFEDGDTNFNLQLLVSPF